MNTTDIVYKVRIPGQAPITHSPVVALYSQAAVKFFVEVIAHQAQLFAGQPFAMCAYHGRNQGETQEIAQGTYQLRLDPDGVTRLWTLYESGALADYGGCGVISEALIEACMQIEEEHEERHLQHS